MKKNLVPGVHSNSYGVAPRSLKKYQTHIYFNNQDQLWILKTNYITFWSRGGFVLYLPTKPT